MHNSPVSAHLVWSRRLYFIDSSAQQTGAHCQFLDDVREVMIAIISKVVGMFGEKA